ncbi:MAG: NYN domain-containing protein [Gemmatimonadota bacterium]
MNEEYVRAPHRRAGPAVERSPNAALLIDFDNVTMGIRSNLGLELRKLLESDMIRGKVAVQRAYADWRRYPQYIVPLSESSIDLIFAPAYGSSKKNATDIRLAIDALELVFIRPEIGTFILLSGDSDFSSLVLKLKEYGKYVIGVGMRASSSDILVQNCDEYYSYNSLSGLTSASDLKSERLDPWELAQRSLARMVERGDVMRSDRLKQVMLELDPSFDEKAAGFSKFNRFLAEAAQREILQLRKCENGQYEVIPATAESGSGERVGAPKPSGSGGSARSSRRRSSPSPGEQGGGGVASGPAGRAAAGAKAAASPQPTSGTVADLKRAYDLLLNVVVDLARDRASVRDSEVKREILVREPRFDQMALGFSKFSRFLQQASDEGVVDLIQGEDGNFYLAPVPRQAVAEREELRSKEDAGRRDSGRRRGRSSRAAEREAARTEAGRRPPRAEQRPEATPEVPESTGKAAGQPQAVAGERDQRASRRGLGRYRRKPRGGETKEAAPADASAEGAGSDRVAENAEAGQETAPRAESRESPRGVAAHSRSRGLGRFRRGGRRGRPSSSVAETQGRAAPEGRPEAGSSRPDRVASGGAPAGAPGGPATAGTGPAEDIVAHMVRHYEGVGKRTAERLVEEFGDRVWDVIDREPERLAQLLSQRRARAVLEARRAELGSRR